jgi:exonuclease III
MFDVIFLQETKLSDLNSFKKASFLPAIHDQVQHIDASGTAGGILISWNSKNLKLSHSIRKNRSITVHLQSQSSEFHLWATNVYGPTTDSDRDAFFEEIIQVLPFVDGPWIIAGGFQNG